MIINILREAIVTILVAATTLLGSVGLVPEQKMGATIPIVVALFETTLALKISSSATSMTLTSGTTKDATTLSGVYGFVIDEGTASEEFVSATCTDTACTTMSRGVSVITGNTEITALKKSHRRGSSVKISNHPQLAIMARIMDGDETFPNVLTYATAVATSSFSASQDIISRGYADALSFGAIPEASTAASGFVEIATSAETAAGTATGTIAILVPANSVFTTTSSATTIVPVTGSDGKLDSDFIPTIVQPPVGSITAYATSTPPTGWLLCDGSSISTSTYSGLFAIIGYGYGGSTSTFDLPDLSGRNIIGYGSATTSIDTMGETGGELTHIQTIAEMAAHTHGFDYSSGGGAVNSVAVTASLIQGYKQSQSTGSGTAFNVLDPFMVLNYIIKY